MAGAALKNAKMDKLGRILVGKGLISDEELKSAIDESRKRNIDLPRFLLESGSISEEELLRSMAERHGMSYVDVSDVSVESAAIRAIPAKLASHYHVLPLSLEQGVLTIAVSDPLDMTATEDIETNLGYRVDRALSSSSAISEGLRKYYGVGADTVERILATSPETEARAEISESHDLEKMAGDVSVVRLVNQLIQEAIRDRATDIHFEVERNGIRARRRIDGVMYETSIPPNIRRLYPAIVSRIKLMSGLDIVERRLPQDGRARVSIGRREYDLRVSVVPAMHGEDIVIRILPTTMLFDLGDLGLSEEHRKELEGLVSRPHGIIFLTGPTGSGKTTTLYACLSRLNSSDRKIITIEDPVEYELKGTTQTQINPRIGLTFARALRSMLRHDPDVMMVGEVRDKETAEIAIQAAMTGHLVLSTLHTNDAAGGAVRLVDMKVDPYRITSTVECFIAQRLVRMICENCREPYDHEGETLYKGKGCRSCRNSGYRGRVAICEFLTLVPAIQEMILHAASAKQIREKANELGMRTLLQAGWEKARNGQTTVAEVMRVTAL